VFQFGMKGHVVELAIRKRVAQVIAAKQAKHRAGR
jgi:hypothetical protein